MFEPFFAIGLYTYFITM